MQIGQEKPKYVHKKMPKTEADIKVDDQLSAETEIEENKQQEIAISEEGMLGRIKHLFSSLSIKTHRFLAQMGLYAGIISMIKGASNACRSIPANPFLVGVGVVTVILSLVYWFWTYLT